MNVENYVTACNEASTSFEAEMLTNKIYSCDSSTSNGSYSSKIPITWDVFYALYNMEQRFDLNHEASSYAAVILSKPKLQANWAKKENVKKYSSLDDYIQDVYIHISTKVIKSWDQEKNNNFWAYLEKELLTVIAQTVDLEISNHMQQKHSWSSVSYDQLLDTPDSSFDISDETDVEATALDLAEAEERADYNLILNSGVEKEFDKAGIRNGLIASQLFGGLDKLPSSVTDRILNRLGCRDKDVELVAE